MKLKIKNSYIAAIFCILIPTASVAQKGKASYRNGQDMTEYSFPLCGDVEVIEYQYVYINPDTGKEYPSNLTTIEFNEIGDVAFITPYINPDIDVVFPATLRLIYNLCGQNTEIIESTYSDNEEYVCKTSYTYDAMGRKVRGERYNSEGKIYRTEEYEYRYDSMGNLSRVICRENGILDWSRSYDTYMNIVEIKIYYHDFVWKIINNTYDENGNIVRSEEYTLNKFKEMRYHTVTTYAYDENGFLMSSEEMKSMSDTETVINIDRKTYRCDLYGNVIEETYYPNGSLFPKSRMKYKIKYR